ncbi:MAG: hypothetical protein JWM43_3165 [Acidobacteriaceae bacterium]|nr:hypothetical protein [Acidobacteriaceae bacterium]
MPPQSKRSNLNAGWNDEAKRLASQARVLSGEKLIELTSRLQRITGNSKDACWRFIRQHALRSKHDYRRWTPEEFDQLREELASHPLQTVAKKLGRTKESIRSILARNGLSVRAIRCDVFSAESLASALKVGRREVLHWIEQGWLETNVERHGNRSFHTISPEALARLYRNHLVQLIERGLPNRGLFEAYLQYCYVPKHTTSSQLLDVRRDKREREAFDILSQRHEEPL